MPLKILTFAVLVSITVGSSRAFAFDLVSASAHARDQLADGKTLHADTCVGQLAAISHNVSAFSSDDVERADLKRDAGTIVKNLWSARLGLRHSLVAFAHDGVLTAACVSSVRNTFRTFRFLEEYVGLHTLDAGAWVNPQPARVFSGGFPWLVLSPSIQSIEFHSGDVLVSYGMAYGSAAITYVGENAGTFSHMAMVYKDPSGQVFTIEAHPEFGVKVAPIEKYLGDGKGRSALFRHRDPELAALAAKKIYDIAYAADSAGHPIPYDFSMDIEDHSKLFCTEVVKYGFDLAEKELHREAPMPAYPTRISLQNPYILDAFGIKSRVTFAPSDIEVDPQFEMLAEWRDLARSRLMHHQQAALSGQFKWLDALAYNYRSNLQTVMESGALYQARHLPLFEGLVDQLVPPDLSQATLEAVVQVYLVSDQIHSYLINVDRAFEAKGHALMTMSEIEASTEQGRLDDLDAYLAYQRWLLWDRYDGAPAPPSDQWHWMLRSDDEVVK